MSDSFYRGYRDRGSRGRGRGSRGRGRGSHRGGRWTRDESYESRDGDSGRSHSRGARGSSRGGARGGKIESFGFRNLQSMAEKDADELVLDMTSERCLLATENLVDELHMDDGKVVVVLNVFAKACSCETTRSSLHKLLSKLPQSTFLNLHLSNYINRLANVSRIEVEEKQTQLRSMITIFRELLVTLPNSFADLPIPQLYFATISLNSKGELFDTQILSEVEELGTLKDTMADKVKQEDEIKSRGPRRRNRRDEGRQD